MSRGDEDVGATPSAVITRKHDFPSQTVNLTSLIIATGWKCYTFDDARIVALIEGLRMGAGIRRYPCFA